jgi:hypothetical protein
MSLALCFQVFPELVNWKIYKLQTTQTMWPVRSIKQNRRDAGFLLA